MTGAVHLSGILFVLSWQIFQFDAPPSIVGFKIIPPKSADNFLSRHPFGSSDTYTYMHACMPFENVTLGS